MPSPIPALARTLSNVFRGLGYEVDMLPWGSCGPGERRTSKIVRALSDALAVRRRLATGRYGLLYVHTAHSWNSVLRDLLLLVSTASSGCSAVLHFHGSRVVSMRLAESRLFCELSRSLVSWADAIAVLSKNEELAWHRECPETAVFVVRNPYEGSDKTTELLLTPAPSYDRLKLLFVGRVGEKKGAYDLLKAMAVLRDSHGLHLELDACGEVLEPARWKKLIVAYDLVSVVTTHGRLTRPELDEYYAAADVLVLPSHGEGFPTVVLEAMSANLPVIVSAVGGVVDIMSDGIDGLLVEPGDVSDLVRALLRISQDRSLSRVLAGGGRATLCQFSPDSVSPTYARLLKFALESSKPQRVE